MHVIYVSIHVCMHTVSYNTELGEALRAMGHTRTDAEVLKMMQVCRLIFVNCASGRECLHAFVSACPCVGGQLKMTQVCHRMSCVCLGVHVRVCVHACKYFRT